MAVRVDAVSAVDVHSIVDELHARMRRVQCSSGRVLRKWVIATRVVSRGRVEFGDEMDATKRSNSSICSVVILYAPQ